MLELLFPVWYLRFHFFDNGRGVLMTTYGDMEHDSSICELEVEGYGARSDKGG